MGPDSGVFSAGFIHSRLNAMPRGQFFPHRSSVFLRGGNAQPDNGFLESCFLLEWLSNLT